MTIQIVIDVAGEAAGVAGESRSFEFSKVDPTPPLVTLSLDDDTGITEYDWELVSQPEGGTSTLSATNIASPTFTPTASLPGSYIIRCTVNSGEDRASNGLAYLTEHLSLRKPGPGESTEFNATRGWEVALGGVIDVVDDMGSAVYDASGARRPAVKDVVDCTAAPPVASEGDRYILDNSGAPEGGWGDVSANDLVVYNGSTWDAQTPSEGWVAYVDAKDADYRFIDDGAGTWEEVTGGAGGGYTFSNHLWIDADNGSDVDGDGTQGNPYATLATATASVAAPASFAEYQTQWVFHVGPGVYTDPVTMPYRLVNAIIGYGTVLAAPITWNHSTEYLFGETGPSPLLFLSGEAFGYLTVYDIFSKNADVTREALASKAIYIDGCFVCGSIIQDESGSSTPGNGSGYLKLYLAQCTFNPNIPSGLGPSPKIGGVRETVLEDSNAVLLTVENCDLLQKVCGCTILTDIRHAIFRETMDYRIHPITGAGSYAGHISGVNAAFGFGDMGFVDSSIEAVGSCVFGNNGVLGGLEAPVRFDASSFAHFGAGATYDNLTTDYEFTDQAEGVGVDNTNFGGNVLATAGNMQEVMDELARPAAEKPWRGAFVNSSEKIGGFAGQAQDVYSCSLYTVASGTNTYLTDDPTVDYFVIPRGSVVSANVRIVGLRAPTSYGFPVVKVWDVDFTVYNDEGHIALLGASIETKCETATDQTDYWKVNLKPYDVTESLSLWVHVETNALDTYFQGSLRATILNKTNVPITE